MSERTEAAEALQGTSSQEKTDDTDTLQIVFEYIAVCLSALLLLVTFPLTLPGSIKIIQQYERGVKVRLGRDRKKELLKPGVVFVFPCVDELWLQDIRTKCYETPKQQVLTKDSVSIEVNAALTVDVRKPYDCILVGQGTDIVKGMSTRRALASLRAVCGKLTLAEIIEGREKVSRQIKTMMKKRWGRSVEVTRVEIKNISMPTEMERSMASEAISRRQAKAKVLAADGEIRASRVLKEAADIVSASPSAIQLRLLHTMLNVSKKNNNTVVVPVPREITQMIKEKLSKEVRVTRVKPL
ncbi:protein unc-1-like [Mercenaria mercenaria]|uniref:protein unc-1-like n=1 Tax=Mercenaria mercenaria TaxID=6596 RepID=UPI00234F5FA7|nr:protein unc-1-like [Mercenaria mercenaria]